MLFVERSNRTERLLAGLAGRLMRPGRDPLAPGLVVVQGPGMERWIAQSIAREYGVCANTEFPFPREFLERIFGALPDESLARSHSGWEVRGLVWRVAKHLVRLRDEADFAPLARHLDATDGDWRLVQLAQRIANLLDRYIVFRPDWIAAWTTGADPPGPRDERWQARLFREIHAELGPGHLADRARAFSDRIASDRSGALEAGLRRAFPDVVEIFAVSTLPPLYLSAIEGLARTRDVHLSVLSPSRHYWADLWREARDRPGDETTPLDEDGEPGLFERSAITPITSLLIGLGRLGSDFQRNLETLPEIQEGERDLFESPGVEGGAPSLLARFQARILELDDELDGTSGSLAVGIDANGETGDRIVRRDDDSIRVHVCHGPRRELEVVESILRHAFERDETLMPEDVIVMAPRIDEIAADIDAVFGVSADDPRAIPYRIADRGAFRRSPVAEAFRQLLGLLGGRAPRSEFFDWLAREPVRERFGFDEDAVEILSEWAERAGIRFGFDEDHRERLGLARERGHTLRGGLDRLALAHAVGIDDGVHAGSSATPLPAMGDRAWLGSLGDLESILGEANRTSSVARNVEDWCDWLRRLLERTIVETSSNAHEHVAIRGVLVDLAHAAGEADFGERIPFEAIRERVLEAIESTSSGQAFLSGGVTFCELVPLRAIPFRVIAILGLCDDAFPRGGPPPDFDLMAKNPRSGDRTSRHDDRYLFLEALLSARDQLVLTVPGRDLRDGRDLPPSVVVTELVEALDRSFVLEGPSGAAEGRRTGSRARSLSDWLVVSHPLQAFSPRYFEVGGDPRLVGRDEEAWLGAEARRAAQEAGGGQRRRFLDVALEPDDDADPLAAAPATLTLDDLIDRVLRSTREFVRNRLMLRLPRPESITRDLDPIELDPLWQSTFGRTLLDRLDAGGSIEEGIARLMADPSVPLGMPGRLASRTLRAEVEAVMRVGRARRRGDRLEDRDFELRLDGVVDSGEALLVGRLDRLWSDGRVDVGFARLGRTTELDLWIRHLVLCALAEGDGKLTPRSVLVGRPERKNPNERVVLFGKVEAPRRHLSRLFEWAWSVRQAPLPFFPRTSRVFAEKFLNGKVEQAWNAANQSFLGGESMNFVKPEALEDLEIARLWEGASPLEARSPFPVRFRFEELAALFFEPFFEAREVQEE